MKQNCLYYEKCLDRINNHKEIISSGNTYLIFPKDGINGYIEVSHNNDYSINFYNNNDEVEIDMDKQMIKNLYKTCKNYFEKSEFDRNSKILKDL